MSERHQQPDRHGMIPATLSEPSCIRFEVRDRTRRVICTISGDTLEAVGNLARPVTEQMRRRSFDRFRTLIDAAAKKKLLDLPDAFAGPLDLSAEDLRSVPASAGTPVFGGMSWTPQSGL